jgi:opacity protein-like surface antigen
MHRFWGLVIILSGLTFTTAIAQDDDDEYDRFSLNIAGGKSLSVRELATKVFGETRGELADDGIGAQIIFAYYPTRRLGLATRFSYNQNRTRAEGIKLIASGQYGVINPIVESSEDWNALSAMIGPSLRLGGRRLGLEGRLLFGYAIVNSPTFVTTGSFQNYDIRVSTKTQNARDWAYGAGATLNLGLIGGLSLVVNADATLISTTFKNVNNQITTPAFPPVNQLVDIEQHVGVLNVTGGLRFAF